MTIAQVIVELVRLCTLVIGEILTAKKAAAALDAQAIVDRESFERHIASALERMRAQAKAESQQAVVVEDEIDKELRR